jgi:hypothetical protein
MKKLNDNSGFTHIALVALFVVLVAAVVFVGLKVRDNNQTTATTSSSPSVIKSSTDLTQTQNDLDSLSAPDPDQLDKDIQNLL